MKLRKPPRSEILMPEKWKCYDGCPVCRILKKAAEEGKIPSSKELEEAFREAGEIENRPN